MKRLLPLLILVAVPASAQEQVYRLSEADKQAAIEEASHNPEHATLLPIIDGRAPGTQDNRPHGEVGMMIGTGGTRAIWATTAIPLGENGTAQLSFSTGRYNNFGGFGGGRWGYNQYAGGTPFFTGRSPYSLGGLRSPY